MYCAHCGGKLSKHGRFCPNCGQPITQAQESAEEHTSVLQQTADETGEIPETTVMPQEVTEEHTQALQQTADETGEILETTVMLQEATPQTIPAAVPAQPYDVYIPMPEPTQKKKSYLLPILIAALAVIIFAVIGVSVYSKGSSHTVKTTEQEQTVATGEPEATETEAPAVDAGDGEGEAVTPTDSPNDGSTGDSGDKTIENWKSNARSFMNVYPVNHILAGGAGDEPSPMSIDDWAANCLRYVNEDSDLGRTLVNDPDSVATPLGFYEVSSYVSDTEVVSADNLGVVVKVTIEGTQMDWDHTSTVYEAFLVKFDGNGKITSVVKAEG